MSRTPLESLLQKMHAWVGEERTTWELARLLTDRDMPQPNVEVPQWLDAALRGHLRQLSQHWCQSAIFSGVRAIERLGLASPEHDETYILAMVGSLGDRRDADARVAAIRADAEIRETLIWRVFEVEGGGEVSLANVDKYSRADAGWAASFRVLVAEGTLPRDRVLRSCLRALARDFRLAGSPRRTRALSQRRMNWPPTRGC